MHDSLQAMTKTITFTAMKNHAALNSAQT